MPNVQKYLHIEIDQLRESSQNPRQHFDEAKLTELAANIAEVGILQPLLVRPTPRSIKDKPVYEIGAGHRRYRAAKIAKLTVVPCLVREMSDQKFVELLNIENLQREDVHPLDEAKGYEALMRVPYTMKVEALAQKVGKSVKYVYDRIKLLALTKPARDLFWSGTIEAGHAILLARLTPTEQAYVIGTEKGGYDDGGLLVPEHRLFRPDEARGVAPHMKAVSVRELQAWIDRHVRFTGKTVDAMLFPETAAQITNATEMKRKIIEITHEHIAQDAVRHADKAKVYGERAWARADGQQDSTVCEHAVLGVIASGPGRGEAFDVCVRKDQCLVHWGKQIRARAKRARDQAQGNTGAVAKADQQAESARQRQNDEYERAKRKREAWEKIMPEVKKAILAKVTSLSTKATGPLGDLLIDAVGGWRRVKTSVPRGKTADDLVRHLAGICLCAAVEQYDACHKIPKLAKQIGIDLSTILRVASKASSAVGSKEPAAQTSAPGKKARRKKAA